MWTLHKLNSSKRKREEASQGSPRPDASGSISVETATSAIGGVWVVAEAPVSDPGKGIPPSHIESPWEFSQEELKSFPALCRRNFWCIQRHQARALHYDLRMQLDRTTFSWAIPRGLLGISKRGEKNRLAVQTTLHPISYTTYEGGDGRILPSGERCGTLLWDVGSYTIDYPWRNDDSDSENEKRKRRNRGREDDGQSDDLGKHEEDKFRMAMHRPVRAGKSRSFHFTLRGGRKMTNHCGRQPQESTRDLTLAFILIQSPQNALNRTFSTTGRQKINWFISLPKGVEGYPWDNGGEEGDKYGRSVKTGRTLREVCAAQERIAIFQSEERAFGSWGGDVFELGSKGEDGVVAGPSKIASRKRKKER